MVRHNALPSQLNNSPQRFWKRHHLFWKCVSFCKRKICSIYSFQVCHLFWAEKHIKRWRQKSANLPHSFPRTCFICVLLNINKAKQHLRKLRHRQKCRGGSDSNRTEYKALLMYKSGLWDGLVLCNVLYLSNSAQKAGGIEATGFSFQEEGSPDFLVAEKHKTDFKASPWKRIQLTDRALGNIAFAFCEIPVFTAFPCSTV